ncbi:MAG TPA: C39 family peptidase [Chitinivibrionales bacterium]|nr:C39 family peptidase [Chitinivibrionales bacterium]
MSKQENNTLFSRGWLIPLSLLAGTACAGGAASLFLIRYSLKKKAISVALASFLFEAVFLGFILFWSVKWYWAAITVYAVHACTGLALLGLVRAWSKEASAGVKMHPFARPGLQKEFIGALGGLVIVGAVAPAVVAMYLLLADRLFAEYLPIGIDNSDMLTWVFFLIGSAMLSGAAGGFIYIRVKPSMSIRQMFIGLASFLFSFMTFWFWLELFIAVPSFQAAATQGHSGASGVGTITLLQWLLGSWLSIIVTVYMTGPHCGLAQAARWAQVFVLHMLTALIICLSWGFSADLFLALGISFERHAAVKLALACYERGLTKKPDKQAASWLQYRVALLYRKSGDINRAQEGFRRVVATYHEDPELVKQAGYFVKRLDEFPQKKRVVLPGVETRTLYRGTYCVPNSMALVMRYWGKKISARRIGTAITGLSSGTYPVDQAWFAYDLGMRHDFLPLATLDDIKRCIDAGFPVLVYVPSHALVLFGYDDALSTFVTYDVATNEIWTDYIQRDFVRSWKRQASTLVLIYPPEASAKLPVDIRERCRRASGEYIHYQVQFFDTLQPPHTIAHLRAAAGKKGEFFLPAATLYIDYPGLRDSLSHWFDSSVVASNIYNFFSRDYDEGVHLWGHIHEENWAMPDWAFRYGVRYLLAHNMYANAESLVTAIENKGTVSAMMRSTAAIAEFAQGKIAAGIESLERSNSPAYCLYHGLACEKLRKKTESLKYYRLAVQESFSTDFEEDAEYDYSGYNYTNKENNVDDLGYPAIFIASDRLCELADPASIGENLVKTWESWTRDMPYDTAVTSMLVGVYNRHIAKLAKKDEPYVYANLVEKRDLMVKRLLQYRKK